MEYWDNFFAPKLIQNETFVKLEVDINNFVHPQDSKASNDIVHLVSSDKEIFKLKTTWSS